jgi:hypothetical protein
LGKIPDGISAMLKVKKPLSPDEVFFIERMQIKNRPNN